MRWWRIKMFNTKLSAVRIMKRLRICVLLSVRPSGSVALCGALCISLARGSSGRSFSTRGSGSRAAAGGPWINPILGTLAGGTLPLSVFHKVLPVILSISPAMMRESCALNAGLPIGFSAVIIQAGVVAPLPLLPLPPLPLLGRLGNVVAHMLRPLEGTLRCTDVDFDLGQSSGADDM